jgi:hypothetical protein
MLHSKRVQGMNMGAGFTMNKEKNDENSQV